jgi:hypothetical protein
MKDPDISDSDATSPLRAGAARLRHGALWVIFALVLMIPKVNRLRRRRKTWNVVRVMIGIAGAAMLAIAVARGYSPGLIAASALMLLFVLVAAPKGPEFSVDARARELGALIVVEGGRYTDASGASHSAKLFVGPDRLWVLGAALELLLEIPLQEVRSLSVEPAEAEWILRFDCGESSVEFLYQGTFAEHLARVAEATIRSRLHRELPLLR